MLLRNFLVDLAEWHLDLQELPLLSLVFCFGLMEAMACPSYWAHATAFSAREVGITGACFVQHNIVFSLQNFLFFPVDDHRNHLAHQRNEIYRRFSWFISHSHQYIKSYPLTEWKHQYIITIHPPPRANIIIVALFRFVAVLFVVATSHATPVLSRGTSQNVALQTSF